MSILIKGMEMPSTGLYFISVDNTGGRDKTIVTVERMLGNRDVRQVIGSFELVPVTPHGRLGDLDKLADNMCSATAGMEHRAIIMHEIRRAPTVIEAEEGK